MKTIGLLGGMSWESTLLYYRLLNKGINERLGGLHSARIAMISVDFHEIEKLQHWDDWDRADHILASDARKVEAAGADFLLLCTNTMHMVVPAIETAVNIPILHIADATGKRVKEDGLEKIGLLGTQFTMEKDFYKERLRENFGLEVIIPKETDRQVVHDVIYQELCNGIVSEKSRNQYLEIIDRLRAQGAQAIIEGCTEITMLVQQEHTRVPLYDTTAIHAEKAVIEALS